MAVSDTRLCAVASAACRIMSNDVEVDADDDPLVVYPIGWNGGELDALDELSELRLLLLCARLSTIIGRPLRLEPNFGDLSAALRGENDSSRWPGSDDE